MEKWSFQRIRELMTHIALRGMAANELGRARISMMVRSISSNTRPDTLVQDRTLQLGFSLATHGGSIHAGHSRQTDTLQTLSACPLRSDLYQVLAPRRGFYRRRSSEPQAHQVRISGCTRESDDMVLRSTWKITAVDQPNSNSPFIAVIGPSRRQRAIGV